jgi:hypothetical protein
MHDSKKGQTMRNLTASILAATLAFSASTAFAGGPVVVVEEAAPEVVEESPRSGFLLPLVVGLIIVCAIACGDDEPDI